MLNNGILPFNQRSIGSDSYSWAYRLWQIGGDLSMRANCSRFPNGTSGSLRAKLNTATNASLVKYKGLDYELSLLNPVMYNSPLEYVGKDSGVVSPYIAQNNGSLICSPGVNARKYYMREVPNAGLVFERWNAGTSAPPDGTSGTVSILRFRFNMSNFFGTGNGQHFAIGIRGDLVGFPGPVSGLVGKGIILGDVTGLRPNGKCGPTSRPDLVTFENFWRGGNCVIGSAESSFQLKNDTTYQVLLIADSVKRQVHIHVSTRDFFGPLVYDKTISLTQAEWELSEPATVDGRRNHRFWIGISSPSNIPNFRMNIGNVIYVNKVY